MNVTLPAGVPAPEPAALTVAVNVTFVPEQMVVAGAAAILTLAAPAAVTDMVKVFEVAGEPVAQVAVEVITQVTVFVFARVVEL